MKQHETTLKIDVKADKKDLVIKVEDTNQDAPDFCSDAITAVIMVCTRMAKRYFTALQERYQCDQGYECEIQITFTEKNDELLDIEVKSDGEIGIFFRNGIIRFFSQDVEFLEMLVGLT